MRIPLCQGVLRKSQLLLDEAYLIFRLFRPGCLHDENAAEVDLAQLGEDFPEIAATRTEPYRASSQHAVFDMQHRDGTAVLTKLLKRVISERGRVPDIVVDPDCRVADHLDELGKRLWRQVGFQVDLDTVLLCDRKAPVQSIDQPLLVLA